MTVRRGACDERNYQTRVKELEVLIGGKHAGTLTEYRNGFRSFQYNPEYSGPDLSLSMPKSVDMYLDDVVTPYVEGLLPDSMVAREKMAERFRVEEGMTIQSTDTMGLLSRFGRDLPGAIQTTPAEGIDSFQRENEEYRPLTDREIRRRLEDSLNGTLHANEDRWSLGGHQAKIALANIDGRWMACVGRAASTHIVKPGVLGVSSQALDEFACQRLAMKIGLSAARTEYREFDGLPVIISQRYDRYPTEDKGAIRRIHQEDLCQAMGFLPANKYGPDATNTIAFLRNQGVGKGVDRFVNGLLLIAP